jgi:ketopantoate reductase
MRLCRFPAEATDDTEQLGPVDMVLPGVKAWQVKRVLNLQQPISNRL